MILKHHQPHVQSYQLQLHCNSRLYSTLRLQERFILGSYCKHQQSKMYAKHPTILMLLSADQHGQQLLINPPLLIVVHICFYFLAIHYTNMGQQGATAWPFMYKWERYAICCWPTFGPVRRRPLGTR